MIQMSKLRNVWMAAMAVVFVALVGVAILAAQQVPPGEFTYVNGTSLVRPVNYREWPWVSSGLGMTYEGEAARPGAPPTFTNVFINPSSYREFMKTGKWPDRTLFVLEFRASSTKGSINTGGYFQGQLVGLEAEVKDAKFPDGWAFYNFGNAASMPANTAPITDASRCVECHTKNTAVERTFVQFYPTLMDVARKMGTVKPGF
jgi:hypothetical protein